MESATGSTADKEALEAISNVGTPSKPTHGPVADGPVPAEVPAPAAVPGDGAGVVGPLASGLQLAEAGSGLTDAEVDDLENEMRARVRAEDFAGAAALRDKLSSAHLEDDLLVLQANQELYKAFSTCDVGRMKKLWFEDGSVHCIHPFGPPSKGYAKVIQSWEKIFKDAKNMAVSAEDVCVHVRGSTGTVVCVEKISTPRMTQLVATNVFRKVQVRKKDGATGSKWLLVHRHVSPRNTGFGTQSMFDDPLAPGVEEAWQMSKLAQFVSRPGLQITFQTSTSNGQGEDGDFDDDEPGQTVDAEFAELGRPMMSDDGSDSDEDSDDDGDGEVEEMFMQDRIEVTRDTIRALRKLNKQGKISGPARLAMMMEIVKNPGETMPERAYELLLGEGTEGDEDDAWADFAALIKMEAKSEARQGKSPNGTQSGKQ